MRLQKLGSGICWVKERKKNSLTIAIIVGNPTASCGHLSNKVMVSSRKYASSTRDMEHFKRYPFGIVHILEIQKQNY